MTTLKRIAQFKMRPINQMARDGMSFKNKSSNKTKKDKICEKVICEICGQKVKSIRLTRHMRKVHPVSKEDNHLSEKSSTYDSVMAQAIIKAERNSRNS